MVYLDSKIYKTLFDISKEKYPHEVCGYILQNSFKQEIKEVKNIAKNTKNFFLMNPIDQLEIFHYANKNALKLSYIFHSHPNARALPSNSDKSFMFPNIVYIIISLLDYDIQAFRITSKQEIKRVRIIWHIS